MVHGFLKERIDRYGLLTAGVEPADSVAAGVLQIFEREGIDPEGIETGPLGRAVNENLRLITYVHETVLDAAPVIAAPCESMVFDLPDPARRIEEGDDPKQVFFQLRDQIVEDVVPRVLEEVQSHQ
jgi:hypothetical protein